MVPRVVYLVVITCIVAGVTTADDPLIDDTSGGERLLVEFPGQPAALCGSKSHPLTLGGGPLLRFTLLQRAEDGRGARDTQFCTLAGDYADLRRLAEENHLLLRTDNLTGGEPVVELGGVQCVLQPDASVPAALFDFRATRRTPWLPPFLCLHLDADWSPAPPLDKSAATPERGALVFRFIGSSVPDLVCRSFSDVPLAESDIEVEVSGFLHPASGPLNCHFRTVSEDKPAPGELLKRLSRKTGAQLVERTDAPAKLSLPSFTCGAARLADQPAPPAHHLSPAAAFTVTGPSGRWTLCRAAPQ